MTGTYQARGFKFFIFISKNEDFRLEFISRIDQTYKKARRNLENSRKYFYKLEKSTQIYTVTLNVKAPCKQVLNIFIERKSKHFLPYYWPCLVDFCKLLFFCLVLQFIR